MSLTEVSLGLDDVAEAIRDVYVRLQAERTETGEQPDAEATVCRVVWALQTVLLRHHPRFDLETFRQACMPQRP